MGTAKQFSFALKDAGGGAVFSKFDICDAYKLMLAKVEDYRLQGFFWLGRYFVETRQPFGGVPALRVSLQQGVVKLKSFHPLCELFAQK